jgi:hypothetical protein
VKCILMISHKPQFFETERSKWLIATDGMQATGLDLVLILSELRHRWFRAINEEELGYCHKQSEPKGQLRERLTHFSADSVCARIPRSKNLVHSPNNSGTHNVYSADEHGHYMVHMERSNLQDTIINITQTQETRRMGFN